MTLYLLDTDHLSQYQRGHAAVKKHFAGKTPTQVFISVITAEEILRGRLAQIRTAKNEAEQIRACYWLEEGLELLRAFAILPYDPLTQPALSNIATAKAARRLAGFTHR